jgi:hypothetical protein
MTLVETVRLLIPDTTAPFIFTDAEINQFIYLESSQSLYISGQAVAGANSQSNVPIIYSVRRSAALALDVIASRLSQQSAVTKLLDVSLNAMQASKAASDRADSLRQQEAELGSFSIAEMVNTDFAARERVWSQLLRIEGN